MVLLRPRRSLLVLAAGLVASIAIGATAAPANPQWIWLKGTPKDGQKVRLRKVFEAPGEIVSAQVVSACDNDAMIFIDGRAVTHPTDWAVPVAKDATASFRGKAARHVLSAVARNDGGPAGLLVTLNLKTKGGESVQIVSDGSWKAAEDDDQKGWMGKDFDDSAWAAAEVVGELGGGSWPSVTPAVLANAAEGGGNPLAPDPSTFKVAKGFKVERLYTVPKDEQGSWVNMTPLPDGRLIVSDQYGRLYTVTPPVLGGDASETKVEPIDVPIGEAQGLLWAFDSLYVVVNRGGKYESGLYRVTDSNKDGTLDKVEMLRALKGGGEHGPHAVVLSPGGKSLHVIAGNATELTTLAGSKVPKIYDEDQILPYMTDGNGFMASERAPGGCIYEVTPDGKDWTLVSMGYRNPFDLAFNTHGDLFTYDSDMEWDVNTPWYRPTRVCQVGSGSDLGYRNGSGKWPTYYPDSLPPTVNIGFGSPTGVAFGYGAKFPAKYQDALYISDWSYGKLYAVHLTPEDSHYKAEVEEFVTGTPLPLTDVVVNPKDGAMYFTIGGRKTLSGLYRVTADGSVSAASAPDTGAEARALRKSLESFHGRKDPKAVDAAMTQLGHRDRFIRYAARVALEWQPVESWKDAALAETDPQASLTALLALTRTGDDSLQTPIFEALARLSWDDLSHDQKLEFLRVVELAIIRMGTPADDVKPHMFERLHQMLDAATAREVKAELIKILIALEDPAATPKAMELLAKAPTQEEQMDYVMALRRVKNGWTPELRKQYFTWFQGAGQFRGGSSLGGFLRAMKAESVATLSDEEKTALKPILEAKPEAGAAKPVIARPFVKEWKLDDLTTEIESKLKGRDFERGRSLFAATTCFSCHRYDSEGGSVGPDLTSVAGRFSARDLLESIILPSKTVSDQYQATTFATTDGRLVTGRVANLNGDTIMVVTDMLDPGNMTSLNRNQIEETKPSLVSMMPEGLLNTLNEDEVFDLMAFLLSRGDRKGPMFK